MKEILAESKNNLLQSELWAKFQESVGKKPVWLADLLALETPILFSKKFYWVQRGPKSLNGLNKLDLPKDGIFIRLEPFEISEKEVQKLKLREVKRASLLGGQKSPKATRVIDLRKSEDALLSEMKPKTRYNIRLAEKKNVSVRVAGDPKDTTVLYQMLEKTAGRGKGYHHFEKDYYQKMMETLTSSDNLFLLIAEHENKPIAAILVSVYGKVATYLHGGFDESARNLMAPYLLQWAAIKLAQSKECVLYDLWGVAEGDDKNDPWAGITRFKEGFGGEKIIFPGAYDLVLNPFWYNFLSVLAKLRRIVKR